MEEEFRAILQGETAVTAICGNRINFERHPQGQPVPAIVLNTISGTEILHMNGTGPLQARVQVDCYADTYGEAKALSRAALTALNAYRAGGFMLIVHDGSQENRPGGTNEAERRSRVGLDFNVTWRPI